MVRKGMHEHDAGATEGGISQAAKYLMDSYNKSHNELISIPLAPPFRTVYAGKVLPVVLLLKALERKGLLSGRRATREAGWIKGEATRHSRDRFHVYPRAPGVCSRSRL